MFGRPVEPPDAAPDQAGASPDETRRGRAVRDRAIHGWGNQANLDLAGSPGRLQARLADVWTQWWRPWALVGILIVGLAIALILK